MFNLSSCAPIEGASLTKALWTRGRLVVVEGHLPFLACSNSGSAIVTVFWGILMQSKSKVYWKLEK